MGGRVPADIRGLAYGEGVTHAGQLTEQEAREHNAIAWLSMTEEDLVRCSASLGHSEHLVVKEDAFVTNPSVHADVHNPHAVVATADDVALLREAADKIAVEHAGKAFAKKWLRENPDRIDRRFTGENP